jgi:hypothetical protein
MIEKVGNSHVLKELIRVYSCTYILNEGQQVRINENTIIESMIMEIREEQVKSQNA